MIVELLRGDGITTTVFELRHGHADVANMSCG